MGHGFGELAKHRHIVQYRLSSFEQKAFGGFISHGLPNTLRRFKESFLYVVPPLFLGWVIYDQVEKRHMAYMRKNPADFENDK